MDKIYYKKTIKPNYKIQIFYTKFKKIDKFINSIMILLKYTQGKKNILFRIFNLNIIL